jgi:hypothetical protein
VFLKSQHIVGRSSQFDGALFDPPYSPCQANECYSGFGSALFDESGSYWIKCKDVLSNVISVNGRVICFGWNSLGLGINRGFQLEEVLLVPHGGSKNDTIMTVERKCVVHPREPNLRHYVSNNGVDFIRHKPNCYFVNTFQDPRVNCFLTEYISKSEIWIDPFCGASDICSECNDFNPTFGAQSQRDALLYLRSFREHMFDGCILDPPRSITEAAAQFREFGRERAEHSVANMGYWARVKDEIARILKPGGKAICFGWSSMGLGLSRGATLEHVRLFPFEDNRNDLIVTVEKIT